MVKKAFDLKMIDTKDDLIKIINECGLPYSALIYILSDIQHILQTELNKAIPQQKEAYRRELSAEAEKAEKAE